MSQATRFLFVWGGLGFIVIIAYPHFAIVVLAILICLSGPLSLSIYIYIYIYRERESSYWRDHGV